jgi:DNA-binding XRE family transcriptional regulator
LTGDRADRDAADRRSASEVDEVLEPERGTPPGNNAESGSDAEPTDAGQPLPGGFAGQLKLRRIAARMTQEELAQRAHLSVRTVRNLERKYVIYPRPASARLLGTALGLAGSDLAQFMAAARAEYWSDRRSLMSDHG